LIVNIVRIFDVLFCHSSSKRVVAKSHRLVGNPSEPLFGKEGQGEILWRQMYSKNPPLSPFPKGGGYTPLHPSQEGKKDSLLGELPDATGQAGMTDWETLKCVRP